MNSIFIFINNLLWKHTPKLSDYFYKCNLQNDISKSRKGNIQYNSAVKVLELRIIILYSIYYKYYNSATNNYYFNILFYKILEIHTVRYTV